MKPDQTVARGLSGNVAIVRRVMHAVRERDLEAILEAYAANVEIRDADSLPYGGVYRGHEGTVQHAAGYMGTWGPLQTPEDSDPEAIVFGEGDRVVALWRQKATGGDGARFDMPALSLFELREEKVVRLQMFHYDTAAVGHFLRRQDDAVPEQR